MILDSLPIFRDLAPAMLDDLLAQAARRSVPAGDVVCYPGDPADALTVLAAGSCTSDTGVSGAGAVIPAPALLDPVAALGGLPHRARIAARENCDLLSWPVESLWADPGFAAAARRWLAGSLIAAGDRRDALAAPVHYAAHAQPVPGPFLFEDVTLIFAFCDAELDVLRAALPDGLRLFRRPGRRRDSLLLALADFPNAHPEHDPAARFGYTDTTVFVPVRAGRRIGLYVPYIYPSTYEPILLGREIYGFPKRLGLTTFGAGRASLAVDGVTHAALTWDSMEASDEPRLVRALMDWLGLEGWSLSVAFQAGEVLRKAMRLPPFRRVSVYNHKRILDASADHESPSYAVDQITQAVFGVLRWYQIARMAGPALVIPAGPLAGARVTLREAYRTQLDMRLSRGKVIRDLR